MKNSTSRSIPLPLLYTFIVAILLGAFLIEPSPDMVKMEDRTAILGDDLEVRQEAEVADGKSIDVSRTDFVSFSVYPPESEAWFIACWYEQAPASSPWRVATRQGLDDNFVDSDKPAFVAKAGTLTHVHVNLQPRRSSDTLCVSVQRCLPTGLTYGPSTTYKYKVLRRTRF